jgi:hypothetical protein
MSMSPLRSLMVVVNTTVFVNTAVLGQQPAPTTEPRLQRLVGRWIVTANTFGMPADGSPIIFLAVAASDGKSIYSTWTQGRGASYYEANALWAFNSTLREVRVFESNTLGAAELHVGQFDAAGQLRLELRDARTGAVRERRSFALSGDTLKMTAGITANDRETLHVVTMVRERR